MHTIPELFDLSRPFVAHAPQTAELLLGLSILAPTVVLLMLAVPAARRKWGKPLRGWLLGLSAGLSPLVAALPFMSLRAFGAGIAAFFGTTPAVRDTLGFPWNADLLALELFWIAVICFYLADPLPGRRRTVTVSLLAGAIALDVLYGRYLQARLDAAETVQYAENTLGLHVDLPSVLFVLLNLTALALPLCSTLRNRSATAEPGLLLRRRKD
ncbi:MAG TPA: hypothetical protein H9665_04135 [Firmicutes bacterium]|nr:hypothetical protein [Bacillota bacterium]